MQYDLSVIAVKVLIDQNISFRLKIKLSALFEYVEHIKSIGFTDKDDLEIWNFARKENYFIITQDADFNDINELKGWPPKIIWLRCGNQATGELLNILLKSKAAIKQFAEDSSSGLLEIYK